MRSNSFDDKMFEILVREHHRRILAYALSLVHRPEVAEDLVQEAFLTAYRKLPEFDPSRNFGNWVRGIVRLEYFSWARRQKELPMGDDVIDLVDVHHQEWETALADGKTELLHALQGCLQTLQEITRKTVDLFYMKKQSCLDIATQTSASEPVVRKRLERARQTLLLCMRKHLGAENVTA